MYTMAQLTDDIHLIVGLVANFLENSLNFYLLVGNEDALKFVKRKIQMFENQSGSSFIAQLIVKVGTCIVYFGQSENGENSVHPVNVDILEMEVLDARTREFENAHNPDLNEENVRTQHIYVVPLNNA